MASLQHWRRRAREIRRDTFAIYLACRDPRTPWYAKVMAGLVVAYALSPVDLIPDFIPVVGYLDDLVLIPLGLWLVQKMVSPALLEEHRQAAAARMASKPRSWLGAGIVVALWVAAVAGVAALLFA